MSKRKLKYNWNLIFLRWMMMNLFNDRYKIKSLRLSERDYSTPGSYFITLCTQWQKSYFGKVVEGDIQLNSIGKIIQDTWFEIPYHFEHVELDICMIMPNPVHCIITINESNISGTYYKNESYHRRDNSWIISPQDISWNVSTNKNTFRRNMLLSKIIGKFKMQTAKKINQIQWTTWKSFWQANYYEHVIRNERDLERIRTYIMNNPYKRRNDEYYK